MVHYGTNSTDFADFTDYYRMRYIYESLFSATYFPAQTLKYLTNW
jgi:hypothetical protein